jgi:hypothetical protein
MLVQPMCHEGFCTGDTDPSPSAPGVFISYTVTSETCFGQMHTDVDQDALSDFCENNLASYFAPALVYSTNDNIEGEPRWAARTFTEAGLQIVRLLYLPSCYTDNGASDPLCAFAQGACDGHFGDSEAIGLDLYFNDATQHWVLHRAKYSEHTSYNVYERQGSQEYPPAISYYDRAGGRPRACVAFSKHANYASQAEFNAGGTFGFDNCYPNATRILGTGDQRNLGSNGVKRINCVYSGNPLYSGSGRQECYWNAVRFSGWTGGAPDSDPHRDRLATFGFIP